MRLQEYMRIHKIGLRGDQKICMIYPSRPNKMHEGIVSDIQSFYTTKRTVWIHYAATVEQIKGIYCRSNHIDRPVVIVSVDNLLIWRANDIIRELFDAGATVVIILPRRSNKHKPIPYIELPAPLWYFTFDTELRALPSSDEIVHTIKCDENRNENRELAMRRHWAMRQVTIYDENIGG